MKQGRRGQGYWSHSIESSGSMPPVGGIPLDCLDPDLGHPQQVFEPGLDLRPLVGDP